MDNQQLTFRRATVADTTAIAELPAASWRNSYAGMLSDAFLRDEVVGDRLAVWEKRLRSPTVNQYVMLAERDGKLMGFVCLIDSAENPTSILLDNLHIRQTAQGQGIGKQLMLRAAAWIQQTLPSPKMHLYVFADNVRAIQFYERLGGQQSGSKIEANFGEQPVLSLRYVWEDVAQMASHLRGGLQSTSRRFFTR